MEKIKVKNEKYFKNKFQMVIYLILFIILIYLFILLGSLDYGKTENDNTKFATDYKLVDTKNVYKFANHSDIYSILYNKNDAIILFGHQQSKWMKSYAEIVNKIAKENNIDIIYYYDFLDDRDQRNGTYEAIVKLLDNYVSYNDLGVADIYAPTLVVQKNEKIIYFDDQCGITKGDVTPDIYWNDYQVGLFTNELGVVFKEYNSIK